MRAAVLAAAVVVGAVALSGCGRDGAAERSEAKGPAEVVLTPE